MVTYLYSHNPNSQSARDLAQAMGIRRIKHENSRFNWRYKTVINWGASDLPPSYNCTVINDPSAVHSATNKVYALTRFTTQGISCPEWTTNKAEAEKWSYDGATILARLIVNGSEGRGIEIIPPRVAMPTVPLYVKYIPKKKEFRVHIVNGKVIDLQQKIRKRDAGPVNANTFMVRNTANGFVFIRENIDVPDDVPDLGIKAVSALGLDFGAVDIIWNEKQNKSYVLEVNTAPGIVGQTITKYKDALSELCAVEAPR